MMEDCGFQEYHKLPCSRVNNAFILDCLPNCSQDDHGKTITNVLPMHGDQLDLVPQDSKLAFPLCCLVEVDLPSKLPRATMDRIGRKPPGTRGECWVKQKATRSTRSNCFITALNLIMRL